MQSMIDRDIRERFKDTLRRFKIMEENPMKKIVEDVAKSMISNFGTPDKFYASPQTIQDMKGLQQQLDDANKRLHLTNL